MEQRDLDFYEAGKRGIKVDFPTQRDSDFYQAGAKGIKLDGLGNESSTPKTLADAYAGRGARAGEMIKNVARSAEFGSRALADSLSESVGAIPDLVAGGLRSIPMVGQHLAPTDPDYYKKAFRNAAYGAGETISAPLNAVTDFGPNTPQNAVEKTAYGAGKGAGDALTIMAPAAAVSKLKYAPKVVRGVSDALKSQPVLQTAAGSTGGAVEHMTDNPYLGIAAALSVPALSAAPKIAKGMSAARAAKKQMVKTAPTGGELEKTANAAYDVAQNSGAKVSSSAYEGFTRRVKQALQDEGIEDVDFDLYDDLAKGLKAIENRQGRALTIQQLEALRRTIGDKVLGSGSPADRRLGYILRNELDDFVENLSDNDLAEGAIDGATDALKTARTAWGRSRKVKEIEGIFEKAANTASGPENGLRIEFRKILNNEKRRRMWSKDELAAFKDVVEGKPVRNLMRALGKFGFDFKLNSNSLMALLGGGAGYGIGGGLLPALAVPAVGTAAKYGARHATNKAGNYAKALAAQGGKAPKLPAKTKMGAPTIAAPILLGRAKERR